MFASPRHLAKDHRPNPSCLRRLGYVTIPSARNRYRYRYRDPNPLLPKSRSSPIIRMLTLNTSKVRPASEPSFVLQCDCSSTVSRPDVYGGDVKRRRTTIRTWPTWKACQARQSRASLNDRNLVAEETCARVLTAIEALDCRPNASARSLAFRPVTTGYAWDRENAVTVGIASHRAACRATRHLLE